MQNRNIITSSQNSHIKLLRNLSLKKYRQQTNKFAVENLAIIYDALRSGHDFQELFVTRDFIERHQDKFEYLQKTSQTDGYYMIDEALNKSYSQLDTPSGITAIYPVRPASFEEGKSVVYLNGVKDPGNIGTIMRTALAFNVPNIVLDSTCVDIYNFKSINAARDSIFKLNITEDESGTWLKQMKGILPIYAANSNEGVSLSEIKGPEIFCLVLGGESHGISREIMELSDKIIRITISRQIESLNVSCAAAVMLYKLSGYN